MGIYQMKIKNKVLIQPRITGLLFTAARCRIQRGRFMLSSSKLAMFPLAVCCASCMKFRKSGRKALLPRKLPKDAG
jgi:hypothetical protein